jgi:hypothetical protein
MPNAYVKKVADQKGISVDKAESLWKKAKSVAEKEGHAGEYDYITGIFKKMIGEDLTFAEHQLISEAGWETTYWLAPKTKMLFARLFKRKHLKAAVAQYVKFKKQGMKDGVAMHKAAGMYGFESDKLFADLIWDMREKGLLDESFWDGLLKFLEEGTIEGIDDFCWSMILEEGEPTNTSNEVAPDRDHKGTKKCLTRKKEKTKMKSFREMMSPIDEAAKKMRMDASSKRKASNAISKFSSQNYFASVGIPVDAADKALRAVGYRLVQEDGTDYSAIFTGAEGSTTIRIAPVDAPDDPASMVQNTMLALQWYKMPSGKWEVNMYLS